jgi:hypothetical protein
MSASTTMSDRERLIELLRSLFQADPTVDDREILDIAYRNLYEELPNGRSPCRRRPATSRPH